MKKSIKRVLAGAVAGFALIGAGSVTAYAAGYITWGGTEYYQSAVEDITGIGNKAHSLKAERDSAKNEVKGKDEEIKNKQKEIENKQKEVDEKNKEIERKQKELDELRNATGSNMDQLNQAEIDMKHIETLTSDLLDSLE